MDPVTAEIIFVNSEFRMCYLCIIVQHCILCVCCESVRVCVCVCVRACRCVMRVRLCVYENDDGSNMAMSYGLEDEWTVPGG